MRTQISSEWLGVLCVIGASIGFALKGIFIKFAVFEGTSVPSMMIWRYSLALLFFWGFCLYKYDKKTLFKPDRKTFSLIAIAAFFGYYLGTYADFKALEVLDATLSRFILFTFPVFVVLYNSFKERAFPEAKQIVAIITVQLGMYLLLLVNREQQDIDIMGIAWGIIAALTYAVYLQLIHATNKALPSPIIATYVTTVAILCVFPEMAVENSWHELIITQEAFIWLLLTAFLSTFIPLILLAEGLGRIGSSRASLISAFSPVFTVILAFAILDERMTLIQWCGAITIFFAVIILEGKIPVRKLFRRQI